MKHPHLTLTFKKGELTLLSGESESGKTSIFEAFKWCLHGNVKKVYRGDKEEVYVQIEDLINGENVTIYRQARPGVLKITIGDVVITDNKSAQATIDRYYYSSDVWRACSIIEQKKLCYLLECNNRQRMNIVSALAYNKDDPKKYRKMIQDYIQEIKTKYREKVTQYELLVSQYKNEYKDAVKDVKTKDIQENKRELELNVESLSKIRKILPELTTKFQYQNKRKIEKDIVTKDTEEKESLLNSLSDVNKEDVDSLDILLLEKTEQINTLKEKNALYRKWMILREKLKKYPPADVNEGLVTEKYFYECLSQENKYKKEKSKADSGGVKYDKNTIDDKIRGISLLIENYNNINPYIPVYKRLKTKLKRKKELDDRGSLTATKEITIQDVYNERDIYNEMKKSVALLKCPHCNKSIQYKNKVLVACDNIRVTHEEIEKQGNKAQELYNRYQIQDMLKSLRDEIESLEEKLKGIDLSVLEKYKPPKVDSLYKSLGVLKSIEIVTQPKHQSQTIRRCIERGKVLAAARDIPEDIKEMSGILEKGKLEREIVNIKRKYEKDSRSFNKRKQLTSEILGLKNRLQTVKVDEDILEKYTIVTKKAKELEDSIRVREKTHTRYTKLLTIGEVKRNMDTLSTKMSVLYEMLNKAVNLSCKLLEDTVYSISATTEPILYKIFKKSVTLKLNLYKELKGKKVRGKMATKQSVNLDISFDSEKHDKRLCGGEKDRISIALLLALNIHSKSPFILMDEVLSTVSYDTASKCLSQIRKHMKDKYVICIEHNVIEGEYDRVIKLGTTSKSSSP